MRVKYSTITLMVMVALMLVVAGSIGSVADSGNCIAMNAPVTQLVGLHAQGTSGFRLVNGLPMDGLFVALVAGTDKPGSHKSYVSRARDSQNDNRDAILKQIAENPGLRSHDIAKALGMNLGTVRYHLMILSINHLVVEYRDGARQIRYFTNNGSYSGGQMLAISLLKREPMGRLLGALAGGQSMSNSTISAASGLTYSEVNRYLSELLDKGVVVKEPLSVRKSTYRIAPGLEAYVKKYLGIR